MSNIQHVVLVGHCGFDSGQLRRAVQTALPDAAIHSVNSDDELQSHLEADRLLLVNRALDGDFAAADGIGLIHALPREDGPRAMLISNYADAQASAKAAGACEGFGKNDLGTSTAAKRLTQAAS